MLHWWQLVIPNLCLFVWFDLVVLFTLFVLLFVCSVFFLLSLFIYLFLWLFACLVGWLFICSHVHLSGHLPLFISLFVVLLDIFSFVVNFCIDFYLFVCFVVNLCIYLAISHPVKKCESLLQLRPKTSHPIFQSRIFSRICTILEIQFLTTYHTWDLSFRSLS